jgi:hypothetical protein
MARPTDLEERARTAIDTAARANGIHLHPGDARRLARAALDELLTGTGTHRRRPAHDHHPLTTKPGATADDARTIARRLEQTP